VGDEVRQGYQTTRAQVAALQRDNQAAREQIVAARGQVTALQERVNEVEQVSRERVNEVEQALQERLARIERTFEERLAASERARLDAEDRAR
jgi:predicted  nucleic acid-binding Zn-ribbon protein